MVQKLQREPRMRAKSSKKALVASSRTMPEKINRHVPVPKGGGNNYLLWNKEELIAEIKRLKKRKKYGLVWEEKPEEVVELCKTKLPVLKEVKAKEIITDKNQPVNLLIEGDNYHALSVLNYTHMGKIDVIYIDPPYNTGARDWTYNNDYVDRNDSFRHSKWVSMMKNRLMLAKQLLKPDGLLMVAIDDHEIHNLRHLLNDIFDEQNFVSTICAEVNPAGQNIRENSPAISHDYCLIYARSIEDVKIIPRELSDEEAKFYKEEDQNGKFVWDNLRRRGGNSTPNDRPGQWFPLFVHLKSRRISLEPFPGAIKIWPIDPKGIKRIWRVNPDGFKREYGIGNISVTKKAGRIEIVKKSYEPEGRRPKTLWKDSRHSATTHGTKLLMDILGKNVFTYPKSLYLIEDCLRYWAKPDAVVLDFFAGSGTTGHAVLLLNKKDGGQRSFILCTNNENKIAEDVCCPRIKKVIKGHRDYPDITGIAANLKYFQTDFIDAEPTDKNKKKLTEQATEMLCIKEATFEEVTDRGGFKLYKNKDRYTGIIFDSSAIDSFKSAIRKLEGNFSIYIFSLSDEAFEEEFSDLKQKFKLSPIPESILKVYRRIFK